MNAELIHRLIHRRKSIGLERFVDTCATFFLLLTRKFLATFLKKKRRNLLIETRSDGNKDFEIQVDVTPHIWILNKQIFMYLFSIHSFVSRESSSVCLSLLLWVAIMSSPCSPFAFERCIRSLIFIESCCYIWQTRRSHIDDVQGNESNTTGKIHFKIFYRILHSVVLLVDSSSFACLFGLFLCWSVRARSRSRFFFYYSSDSFFLLF